MADVHFFQDGDLGHYRCCGTVKRPRECYFLCGRGIAIIPSASPCLRRGKGSPCEKKKGCLHEEESLVCSQNISRQGGRGKNNIQVPEGSNCFLTRRGCGRGFLHPARQGQAHCRFPARQGSGGRNRGTRSFFWRRMSEWPSRAYRNHEGGRRWLRDYPPGKGDHDRHHSQRAGLF